jgi:hypothetical protein
MAIKLLSSTKIGNFTLPHTDGVSGQALVTDGNGNISFTHTGGVTGLSFASGVLTATRAAGNITVNLDGRYALSSHTHAYDNYQSWNLKTNGVQRTTVQSGGNLDLVAGSNVTISYGAGGVVTIAAGSSSGTVTSVSGTGTVSGLTLSGTVTSSGSLTLGGTLTLTSAQVTTALGFTPYNSTNPSGYITSSGSISGNAATATTLQTARTITIGSTGKTFNGSANVSWTLAEIGAQAAGSYAASVHTHDDRYYTETESDGRFIRKNTWEGSAYVGTGGDFYGTIFYDSNNSGYYMDPASTSNLNGVSARQYYQSLHGEPRNNLGDPTVTDMALFDAQFNNKTEFYPASKVKFFTSSDGTNFTEYTGFSDIQKQKFMGGDEDSGVFIPNLTNRFRIELDASGYVFVSMLYMYWSSNSHSTKMHIWARRCDNQQWYQITSSDTYISSWPGHATLPFPSIAWLEGNTTSSGHHDKIRIEFIPSWSGHATYGGNVISLNRLQMWGGYPAGKRNVFTTYYDRSIAYPGTVSAPTFSGALSGNASTATSAATWTTGRTITIGNTGKTVNGSGDVSWTLAEIGAQAAGNYATQAYVNTAVANVVNSAPAALDTLNELATALGNDASFSTTVSTALGNRLRVDTAAQGLTGTQQSNARTNLGLGTAATSNTGDFATSGHSHSNATTGAAGFMSAADKSKLDGIASGATANAGTVTSVSGTGSYGGLTLSGTVTTSGSLTLGGTPSGTWPISVSGNAATATSATSASLMSSSGALTTQHGDGRIGYTYALTNPQTGLFAATDNANAILTVNRHPGNYYSQLGFSSNGNLYYRNFVNTAINTSQAWQTIWTSSSLTNLNQLSNGPGYTSNTGTVTSVSGTGTVSGLTLSGTVTTSGSLTLGGTLTLTSAQVTTALGFTPYNSTNPNGYITSSSLSSYLPLSGGTMTGRLTLRSISGVDQMVENDYGSYLHLGGWAVGRTDASAVLVNTAYRADYADSLFDMNISRFTNNSGYITGINSTMVTNALGYTPYNSSNPNGYITSSGSVAQLSGWSLQNIVPYHSGSDFPNGTLVVTNINASVSSGDSFVMEVTGKSYQTGNSPFSLILQGYIYADTFINCSAMNNGTTFPNVVILNYGGNLAFWWPRISYWNSFSVTVREAGGSSSNRVTSISDSTEPASSKKVTVSPINVIHSNNISSQSVNYAASAGSVAWGNVSGRPTTVSSFTNDSGYITTSGNASKLNPLSGDSNYKLAYTADGARTNAGEWGRAVMYYVPNGQTYGIRVDRADYADGAGSVAWSNVSGRPSNVSSFTNDSGYVTSGSSPTFTEVYANNWFRNNEANEGLYNQATTQHWSSRENGYWDASSTTSVSAIRFYTGGHVSSLRGYVYADSSNNIGFLNSGGSWSLRCDNSGNVVATGDVTAYSDARIKTDVKTVEDALDKVLALRGVTYKRTDIEDKSTKLGVIAQEVKEVLPEVVSENEDGMLTVSYGNMVGVLIEAMKEQQAMIETLEAKIELLTRYLK